jgi:hypothetical protein
MVASDGISLTVGINAVDNRIVYRKLNTGERNIGNLPRGIKTITILKLADPVPGNHKRKKECPRALRVEAFLEGSPLQIAT